jgi:predicted negative regulator of RcsB-dependent stress response
LTRHELKEQLQHDAFRDNVDVAVGYVALHRQQMIRYAVIALIVAVIAGISYGIYRYQKSQREQALQAAIQIAEAPVSAQADPYGKSFTTQDAKNQAALKALGDVASKYNGTEEGDAAQYYMAGLQAESQKYADAERNFKAVAASGSSYSALAKVGLAELYAGEGKTDQAKTILQDLIAHPTALVSKEQATLLLAGVLKTQDPKRSIQLAESLKGPNQRPAVSRAAEQLVQAESK